MKIFLCFLQSGKQHPIPAYGFWEYYIKNGIIEAGYEWTEAPDVDWALGLVQKSAIDQDKWKQEAWGKTVAWLKKNPADIFLSYLYPKQIEPEAIQQIQAMGIPCVNYFCDNVREFKKIPAEYTLFDLNWVPEYKAVKLYKKAGCKFIHLPMPVWVPPIDRVIKPEIYNQITFLGSKDIQRHMLFESVEKLDPRLPLTIYGSGWIQNNVQLSPVSDSYNLLNKLQFQLSFISRYGLGAYLNKLKARNYNYEISPALLAKCNGGHQVDQYKVLTSQSMVTVGVNRYPSFQFPLNYPDTYSRLRDIEAPMFGACYLTEYTEGLEYLYDLGAEIEVYRNAEDFIEKARQLQNNPDKRKRLRIKGQQKALNEHHIPGSINKILKEFK